MVVKGLEDVLSPPLVARSEFSSDGSRITVSFDSPTNRVGFLNEIRCRLLFDLAPLSSSQLNSLPSSSRCVWTSFSDHPWVISCCSGVECSKLVALLEWIHFAL
jgi:hypothetical protein